MKLIEKIAKHKNVSRFVCIMLFGALLLLVVTPASKTTLDMVNEDTKKDSESLCADIGYYETRLKDILEKSYGVNNINVMIYSSLEDENIVSGVMVVVYTKDSQAVVDISNAVCALFNLPAHKVFVIAKAIKS